MLSPLRAQNPVELKTQNSKPRFRVSYPLTFGLIFIINESHGHSFVWMTSITISVREVKESEE